MYKAYQLRESECLDGCCELCGNCLDIQLKIKTQLTNLEEYNDSR